MALVRATCTFHAPDNVTVPEGALFDEGDEIVRGRERLFERLDTGGPAAAVENHSARPGARSNARRTTKKAATKKAAAKQTAPKGESKAAKKAAAAPEKPADDGDQGGE